MFLRFLKFRGKTFHLIDIGVLLTSVSTYLGVSSLLRFEGRHSSRPVSVSLYFVSVSPTRRPLLPTFVVWGLKALGVYSDPESMFLSNDVLSPFLSLSLLSVHTQSHPDRVENTPFGDVDHHRDGTGSFRLS